jgi:hypothetical protein
VNRDDVPILNDRTETTPQSTQRFNKTVTEHSVADRTARLPDLAARSNAIQHCWKAQL